MAREPACDALRETLRVCEPASAYHTKVPRQAGIIDVRRRGRDFCHAIRRDALGAVTRELRALDRQPKREKY